MWDGKELMELDIIFSYMLTPVLSACRHEQVRITRSDLCKIGLIYIYPKLVTKIKTEGRAEFYYWKSRGSCFRRENMSINAGKDSRGGTALSANVPQGHFFLLEDTLSACRPRIWEALFAPGDPF